MTKPSPKEIKAMADVAGVPVSAEVATRIAGSIGASEPSRMRASAGSA